MIVVTDKKLKFEEVYDLSSSFERGLSLEKIRLD
jgi:hypothetical protein